MSILNSGTPIYLNSPDMAIISGGEPTNKDSRIAGVENIQDYYGDLKQKQKDLIFKQGELIGVVTGETRVVNSVLYYNVLITGQVDKRTSHGWGAGTYEKINWLGWISSESISADRDSLLSKYNKSETIVDTGKDVKKPTAVIDPVKPPVVVGSKSIFTQTDKTTGEEKPNYLLYGGLLFGVILIGVGLYWAFGSKPDPQPIIQYVPQPQPIK